MMNLILGSLEYLIEQLHHPSALDMFEQIIAASKGKQIVMFLDYDGTLSPIVEDPDRAFMSDAVSNSNKFSCSLNFFLSFKTPFFFFFQFNGISDIDF